MIADKIGRYKPVLICGILFTGIFHTLLLTIDAGGNKLQDKANDSSVMQLTCAHDLSGEAFLEWPGCRNSSCLNNSLQISPVIHVSSCNCYEACNGTKTCDQQSLAINLDIQVEFGEMTGGHQHDMCKLPISQMLINNTTDPFVCPCQSQCIVSASGVSCQENQSEYDSNKHQRGFWLYLICRIIATASLGTTFTMLDASAICLVKKYKGDLGKQRLCGVIGSAAFGSVSGILIEWYSKVKGKHNLNIYLRPCLILNQARVTFQHHFEFQAIKITRSHSTLLISSFCSFWCAYCFWMSHRKNPRAIFGRMSCNLFVWSTWIFF